MTAIEKFRIIRQLNTTKYMILEDLKRGECTADLVAAYLDIDIKSINEMK